MVSYYGDFSAPWSFRSPSSCKLAPYIGQTSGHVIVYHLLLKGRTGVNKHLRDSLLSWTRRFPHLSRSVLWMWAKIAIHLGQEPRSLFLRMANILDYRVPAISKLTNGMKIKVVWNDKIGSEIFLHGCHDLQNVEAVTRLLKPGQVFLDIGAHVGQYTLIAGKLVGEKGQVHCFEPDPSTFQYLLDNIRLNDLKNVHANQIGLFNEKTTKRFFLSWPEYMGGNSLTASTSPDDWPGKICEIKCDTLDSYLREESIDRADVIKIDAEGAEIEILQGAKRLLSSAHKPIIIYEENEPALARSGHSARELNQLLEDYGYRLDPLGKGTSQNVRDLVAMPATAST